MERGGSATGVLGAYLYPRGMEVIRRYAPPAMRFRSCVHHQFRMHSFQRSRSCSYKNASDSHMVS